MDAADYAVVKEEYRESPTEVRWRYTLANGTLLTGTCPIGSGNWQEQCREEAQVLLDGFLGLDVTKIVTSDEPSRIEQILTEEMSLVEIDMRLENLRQGIRTGVYSEAEAMPIQKQIDELELYRTVQLRKINELKV